MDLVKIYKYLHQNIGFNMPNWIMIPLLITIIVLSLAMFFKKAHEMLWDTFLSILLKIFIWLKKTYYKILPTKTLGRYGIAKKEEKSKDSKIKIIGSKLIKYCPECDQAKDTPDNFCTCGEKYLIECPKCKKAIQNSHNQKFPFSLNRLCVSCGHRFETKPKTGHEWMRK